MTLQANTHNALFTFGIVLLDAWKPEQGPIWDAWLKVISTIASCRQKAYEAASNPPQDAPGPNPFTGYTEALKAIDHLVAVLTHHDPKGLAVAHALRKNVEDEDLRIYHTMEGSP